MSIVLTFTTDGGATDTWTIPVEVRASLDAYRQNLFDFVATAAVDPAGNPYNTYIQTMRYASVQDLLKGELFKSVVNPALANYTPSSVGLAAVALSAAQATYIAAIVSAGGTTPNMVRNLWPSNTANILGGGFNTNGAQYSAYTTAPDGSNNGQTLAESTGTFAHWYYIYTDLGAGQHTISMHFKASSETWAYLRSTVDGTDSRCWFDLTLGVVGTNGFAGGTSTVTALANGWFRCSVTFTATTGAIYNGCGIANADAVYSYAGTFPHGVYQWGQQIEDGPLSDYQAIPQ